MVFLASAYLTRYWLRLWRPNAQALSIVIAAGTSQKIDESGEISRAVFALDALVLLPSNNVRVPHRSQPLPICSMSKQFGRPRPTSIGESRASRGNRNTQTRSPHGSTSSDCEPVSDEQTDADSAREQRQSAQGYGSSTAEQQPTGAYSRVEVSLGGRNYATKPLLIFDSNRNFSYLPIWHAQCL